MAESKVTVQLEGPTQGNVRMYRVGTIKGAVVLTVVNGLVTRGEVRRGDMIDEIVAVALSHKYGVTIVAPKGAN